MIGADKEDLISSLINSENGFALIDFLNNEVKTFEKKLLKRDLSKEELYKISIEYHNTKRLVNRILSFKIEN